MLLLFFSTNSAPSRHSTLASTAKVSAANHVLLADYHHYSLYYCAYLDCARMYLGVAYDFHSSLICSLHPKQYRVCSLPSIHGRICSSETSDGYFFTLDSSQLPQRAVVLSENIWGRSSCLADFFIDQLYISSWKSISRKIQRFKHFSGVEEC